MIFLGQIRGTGLLACEVYVWDAAWPWPLDLLDRRKSTSRVETSAAEKNLGDADRDLILDQVMKSGVPNSVDDRFFSADVAQEDECVGKVTPTKVKREQEDTPEDTPEKTTEEKKKETKIAKLLGGSASLCSFRANLAEKFAEGLTTRKDKMQVANEKLKEAQAKLGTAFQSEQEPKSSGNDVLSSYNALLETCLEICEAWLDTISPEQLGPSGSDQKSDDKDTDKTGENEPTPPAVQQKQQHLLDCLKKAESQVKLSNGEMEIWSLAMFEFLRHQLMTSTSPSWLVDFESNMKGNWAVQDVFQKALVRIAADVTSYVNQKARNARRNEEKKKKEEESRAAKARRAEAKAQAQKVKQGKIEGHAIFVIDEKMFRPFHDRSKLNSVDETLTEPWIWKSCNFLLSSEVQIFYNSRPMIWFFLIYCFCWDSEFKFRTALDALLCWIRVSIQCVYQSLKQ